MSLALELWRLLEAWDPDKHPRGPGGRFVHLGGGGGHSKRSLADAVKGTAAAGPKRPTAGRSMSVTDAVRAAARRSDTTGRPTQRPVAEHRAHGAHDVADEVDRALAEAGVSEEQRAKVSARARAAADVHGPRPESLRRPARGKAEAPSDAAGHTADPRVAAAAADIRAHVEQQLAGDPAGFVGLADVRDHLGDRYPREVVDEALRGLGAHGSDMRVLPLANKRALTPRDHAAALSFGPGAESDTGHMIGMRPPPGPPSDPAEHASLDEEVPGGFSRATLDAMPDRSLQNQLTLLRESDPNSPKIAQLEAEIAKRAGGPQQQLAAARGARDDAVRQLADGLRAAGSRDAVRAAIADLKVRELRTLAAELGAHPGSKATKARLLDAIVEHAVGARLDSKALGNLT